MSALALGLSAYLSWHHLTGGVVIGCGGGSPCDEVLSSRWSTIGGVLPVSGLAMGEYLALLIANFFLGPNTTAPVRRLAWQTMIVLVGAVWGSAVWFIIVQRWIVGAFCPYCMAAHLTGLLLAALVIGRARVRREEEGADVAWAKSAPPASRAVATVNDRLPTLGLNLAGVALAALMVAGQVLIAPPALSRGGESQNDLSAIDPRAAPRVGSPDARYVVTLLFDYQCPHCQQLHLMLDEVVRRYGGQLAFVLCPAPLNSQCNPYVTRDAAPFRDSCALAKIALAVWFARRDALPAFDRWMFTLESGDRWRPRRLEAARTKAIELVGQAKFEAARADPRVDRYLQASIRIYGATIGGSSAVPKLVFGSHWVVPEPRDADDLVSILQSNLALPAP